MSNEHLYGASHRRTKILATIGPSSDDPIVLRKLFEAGVNACRINFSHGSHPEHAERIRRIRAVARDLGIPMPIVGDLKGPEIRVDRQTYELVEGDVWTIEGRAGSPVERRIGISHPGLHRYVPAGQAILLDDGNLELRVESVEDGVIRCRVVTGGELRPNKSINTPGCENGLAVLSEQDMADLAFAHEMELDWIAISFVKRASDIQAVRTHLEGIGWDDVPLIAKIETMEAVDHLDEIVRWSDGVMVARGDLGVECPIENVPIIQKRTIQLAHKYAKLSIVATQMLDSMIRNPRPTRAEASDVANAVYEGTQVVMLSGETANGLHPLEAVRTMATIVHRAEGVADLPTTRPDVSNQTLELVAGAVRLRDHTKAACIISFVTRGTTAAMLAAFHSPAETIAACFTDRAYHRTALHYGTTPIRFRDTPNLDLAIERITEKIRRRSIADSGQRVIFLFALPHGSRTNNTIRLATIP